MKKMRAWLYSAQIAEEYMCISGNGETEKAVRNVEADHFGC